MFWESEQSNELVQISELNFFVVVQDFFHSIWALEVIESEIQPISKAIQ